MPKKMTVRRNKTARRSDAQKLTFPAVGDVLDNRFKLVNKLGDGAHSVSYQALDTVTQAYKTLKVFGLYTEVFNSIQDIREEAKLYSEYRDPHFPNFHAIHDSQYVYLEFEYVQGTDLYDKLSKHIGNVEKVDYAIQLADSLYSLHKKNIEHKDLKPENILITPYNKLYLIDFGSAAFQKATENTTVEYTPEYCPPETLTGEETPFQRDIFAFGVILYEMFHKKYPFQIDSNGNIDYQMPSSLLGARRRKIDKIIKKCITYYPEDRYQNFTEIIADFDKYMKTENPVFSAITKLIVRKIPLKSMTENFKRDLKYLYINVLLLLLLIPVIMFIQNRSITPDTEKTVTIDTPANFYIYVNGELKGYPPQKAKLKKGDVITLQAESSDIPYYEMSYDNQDIFGRINITLRKKRERVYVNFRHKGLIVNRDQDIPYFVNFLNINGDIAPERLSRKQGKITHVIVTPAARPNIINALPPHLRSLNLKRFPHKIDLNVLQRFQDLENLDLANASDIDAEQLPTLDKLKNLNLNNTRTTNISSLNRLKNLKNLHLRNNNINDINPLSTITALETVDLTNNPQLLDYSPLSLLKNLKAIRTDTYNLTQDQVQIINSISDRNVLASLSTQKRIETKAFLRQYLFEIIAYLLTILALLSLLYILLKLAFKKNLTYDRFYAPSSSKIETKISIPESMESHNFRTLEAAISEKRYYQPDRNNALYFLYNLINRYPIDEQLQNRKRALLETLNEKIQDHLRHNELEPVFLATTAINHYFPSKANFKLLKHAEKELLKPSPLKYIFVKGGTYQMGDFDRKAYLPHEVFVGDFKISETVVTNEQYCKFLNTKGNQTEGGVNWIKIDSPYSRIAFADGGFYAKEPYANFPVYEVSWFGAQRYCESLGGRLPTEAEWEYAARSRGQNLVYSTGNTITKKTANYLENSEDLRWHSVLPVKTFSPNKLGLYEMSGNILEWCLDWYDLEYYAVSQKDNPKGPKTGETKVVRGGAWCLNSEQAATFFRGGAKYSTRNNMIGFRIAMPVFD